MSHQCLLVAIVVFITTEALSVSTETCGKDLLEGTSCIIKLTTKNNEKPSEFRWYRDKRSGYIIRWKGGKIREISEGVSMEEDGSLRFLSVSLKDTGKYTFNAFNDAGTETGRGEVEIKVYEKAPKPAVKIICTKDGKATLTCDIREREDLTLSWYKEDKIIQKNPQVFLSSTQVQENKPYSCEAHNPVSKHKSESVTVSCFEKHISKNKFVIWISIVVICLVFILLFLFIQPLYGSCAARCGRQKTSRK